MDYIDKRYNSLYGIYKEKQGLNNVYCCFGHDEYLYQLLKYNKVNLPIEAYYMIRFEQEAYNNDSDFDYLSKRKKYAWLEYKV